MSDIKKYYWLKLKRDFFKRHDMKIIEAMDNGKDYVLFYLKLLLESIDHEGSLRFSETVPYNEKMLATITDTNIDIVRSAVQVFAELGMMERFDDGTLYMSQVDSMLGSETSEAIRLREIRLKKKQVLITQGESVQRTETYEKRTPELEIEIDKEIDTKKDSKKTNVFSPVFDSYIELYKSIYGKEPIIVYSRITNQLKTISKDLTIEQILLAIKQSRDDDFAKKGKHELSLILSSGVIGRLVNESISKPLPHKINVPRRCKHLDSSGNQCKGEIFNSYCKTCGAMYDGDGNEIL